MESVALFEADLEKVSDRHAQLIGHVPWPSTALRMLLKPVSIHVHPLQGE